MRILARVIPDRLEDPSLALEMTRYRNHSRFQCNSLLLEPFGESIPA